MDLKTLSAEDLHDLSSQIAAEWDRRRASAVTDQAVTEVITGLQDSGKLPAPAAGTDAETAPPWADPGTDHSAMYRQGAYVTHQDKTWLSRHPGLNHWEDTQQRVPIGAGSRRYGVFSQLYRLSYSNYIGPPINYFKVHDI